VSVAVDRGSGAIVEIAARHRAFDFVGVIARRREAYHVRVEEAAARADQPVAHGGGTPSTIHGSISVKEPGLERLLTYDERPRSASQEWILASAAGRLGEAIGSGPVGVPFGMQPGGTGPGVRLASREGMKKELVPGADEREFEVRFERIPAGSWLVSEWNLSLLTADAPGRRLRIEGSETRAVAPGSAGEADGVTSITLEDQEQFRVAITLRFTPAIRLEWSPVETVSLSESGAERVYQGTAFLFGFSKPAGGEARIHARVEEES
jgi:hypothetical protein